MIYLLSLIEKMGALTLWNSVFCFLEGIRIYQKQSLIGKKMSNVQQS